MNVLRSLLFVPGDSERKLAKAGDVPADALVVDLEDAVTPERKAHAREMTREFLVARSATRRPALWVRVNPVDSEYFSDDLGAIVPARPVGIVLPKARSVADVLLLHQRLTAHEARCDLPSGCIQALPIVTETAASVAALGQYAPGVPRLAGLTWGAEDLATAVGATANKDAAGAWLPPFELARSLTLFAAHAAGVEAIDTLHANFRDMEGLRKSVGEGRRLGFTGKLAIHPAQVPIINAGFTPSDNEIAEARRIVAAFRAHPGAGVVALDGRMLDVPHLKQAQRLMALADRD